MRTNRALSAAALVLSVGCGQDTRPPYQTPALAAGQTTTLRGVKGWYVDGVDGSKIDHANFDVGLFGPTGGNEVVVTAGKHHVSAVFHGGGQRSDGSGDVTRDFEAGHVYQFRSKDGFFRVQDLRVVDLGVKQGD